MNMNGSQVVIECLVEQGVDTVFGYPGGKILNIYDELYKNRDRIRHILTAHEQGASHAADGYARSTGKVGVVIATSGPGATNLVTGIATAYMDSVPMVAITCNVSRALLGKDSFQEVDIAGVTMPVTKHNYIVKDAGELATTLREAFAIARSGRPGPVLVDIPQDITAATVEFTPATQEELSARRTQAAPDSDIAAAAELIAKAERPLIYAGGGVIIGGASDELRAFAERIDAPVAVSLMAKTAFPSAHPLCTGMIGMHGTKASNTACSRSDLLIAIGARFSDRVISDPAQFARGSKVLHIDIDQAEINKNIPAFASVVGDVKDILSRLCAAVPARKHGEWLSKVDAWKRSVPAAYSADVPLHPKPALEYVRSAVGDDAIIVTEVGQHQMWVAQFYQFSKPRTLLTSGGLGTMGYGTGAAIGAQVANPGRTVIHFAGDGSFRMNCNELATISHYQLPIVIVVVNNGTLGMVRQWQSLFYGRRYSETTLDFAPDFVRLAEAYGIRGYRAATLDEFKSAFADALAERRPAVIDAGIGIDEMVLPMVPGGRPIDELLMEA